MFEANLGETTRESRGFFAELDSVRIELYFKTQMCRTWKLKLYTLKFKRLSNSIEQTSFAVIFRFKSWPLKGSSQKTEKNVR